MKNSNLTEDGSVFSWGHNGRGELGIGSTEDAAIPQKLKITGKVSRIFASGWSSFMITEGSIRFWMK